MSTVTIEKIQTEVTGELNAIFNHLQRLEEKKRDVVCPAKNLLYRNQTLSMFNSETGNCYEMSLNGHAKTQLLQKMGIPLEYANRCNDDLLAQNINGWMKEHSKDEKSFMLRTYADSQDGGLLRAFLSNKYKVIDNFDMFAMILEMVSKAQQETGYQIKAVKNSVTDSNMFLRFIAPEIENVNNIMDKYSDPKTGNKDSGIVTGFIFKNSETGGGKFSIAPRIVFGACSNGAIFAKEAINMVHLGSGLGDGEFSKQTLNLQMETIMSGAKDQLTKWLSKEWLGQKVNLLEMASEVKIDNPIDTMVNLGESLKFSMERTKSLINAFMLGGDKSELGIFHALTYEAQHSGNEDDRFTMEGRATEMLGQIKKFDRVASVKKVKEILN